MILREICKHFPNFTTPLLQIPCLFSINVQCLIKDKVKTLWFYCLLFYLLSVFLFPYLRIYFGFLWYLLFSLLPNIIIGVKTIVGLPHLFAEI